MASGWEANQLWASISQRPIAVPPPARWPVT